jgi:hypothetical protein
VAVLDAALRTGLVADHAVVAASRPVEDADAAEHQDHQTGQRAAGDGVQREGVGQLEAALQDRRALRGIRRIADDHREHLTGAESLLAELGGDARVIHRGLGAGDRRAQRAREAGEVLELRRAAQRDLGLLDGDGPAPHGVPPQFLGGGQRSHRTLDVVFEIGGARALQNDRGVGHRGVALEVDDLVEPVVTVVVTRPVDQAPRRRAAFEGDGLLDVQHAVLPQFEFDRVVRHLAGLGDRRARGAVRG